MIIERSGNGYHAIQKSVTGKIYCGYGRTRQEARQFCIELLPRIEKKFLQGATVRAGR